MIGSCGRPDLVGSIGYTADQMARMMFNSLLMKLAVLPDSVQVSTYMYTPVFSCDIKCTTNNSTALRKSLSCPT